MALVVKHQQGSHDQKAHGRRGGMVIVGSGAMDDLEPDWDTYERGTRPYIKSNYHYDDDTGLFDVGILLDTWDSTKRRVEHIAFLDD